MMSLTFGLLTQMGDLGPYGPLVAPLAKGFEGACSMVEVSTGCRSSWKQSPTMSEEHLSSVSGNVSKADRVLSWCWDMPEHIHFHSELILS